MRPKILYFQYLGPDDGDVLAREKPILIYDGDCAFCQRWIFRWKRLTGETIDYFPFQEVKAEFPMIALSSLEIAVHFVDLTGRITQGAEAVFLTLQNTRWHWLLGLYQKSAIFRAVSERLYRWVARNRSILSKFA